MKHHKLLITIISIIALIAAPLAANALVQQTVVWAWERVPAADLPAVKEFISHVNKLNMDDQVEISNAGFKPYTVTSISSAWNVDKVVVLKNPQGHQRILSTHPSSSHWWIQHGGVKFFN